MCENCEKVLKYIDDNLYYYFEECSNYNNYSSYFADLYQSGKMKACEYNQFESRLNDYKDNYECLKFDFLSEIQKLCNVDLQKFLLMTISLIESGNEAFIDALRDIIKNFVDADIYESFKLEKYPIYKNNFHKYNEEYPEIIEAVFNAIYDEYLEYYYYSKHSSKCGKKLNFHNQGILFSVGDTIISYPRSLYYFKDELNIF